MIVTKEYINQHKTKNGAWTRKQLTALGVEWPPEKGWKKRAVGNVLTAPKAAIFEQRSKTWTEKELPESKLLNAVSVDDGKDWSWKPGKEDIPPIKMKSSKKNKNRGKKKAKREKVSRYDNDCFYNSREWRSLRYRVLKKYDGCCMLCGRNKRDHGIVLHVDHIKPRSKFPHLALVFDNLQILCEDCNMGKSNKDSTDWRPDIENEKLDIALIESIKGVYI